MICVLLLVGLLAVVNPVLGFSSWSNVAGSLTRVSVGKYGVWGVNRQGNIYHRNPDNNGWSLQYGGKLVDISVGKNEVWGVNSRNNIYRKVGGGDWVHIAGKLKQVSVSHNGHVWGVYNNYAGNNIYRRVRRRAGHDTWEKVGGALTCVSVGPSGVWGVNAAGMIFYREGTYGDVDTSGTKWTYISGDLKWISSGNNLVIGVNSAGHIYYREGITARKPTGTKWGFLSGGLAQIDVYNNEIWGVNIRDKIYTIRA